ncbi:MAG: helicase, partial [Prevotella sp.]|nr:helicase [Prevotella sp.]
MGITESSIQALQQQRLLLQLEYQTEKEAYRQQTESIGIGRKVKRGDAWWPLRFMKSYYNSLNQLAVEVCRTTDTDIEHNFEFGRPVVFFTSETGLTSKTSETGKSHLSYFKFTGVVSFVDGDRMVVTIPDNAHIIDLQNA